MNWKNIDENWKSFVKEYRLNDDSGGNNYFYGKQELYKASEDFQEFVIYYQNKFNKSAELGSSFRIGHCLTMVSPIEVPKKWRMTIEKSAIWKSLFNSTEKLKIEISDSEVMRLLPLEDIKSVTSFFPDLKLSIKEFDKYRNQHIPYGQTVLMLETKYQPQELEHLKKARKVISSILLKLQENKKIKPAHITV